MPLSPCFLFCCIGHHNPKVCNILWSKYNKDIESSTLNNHLLHSIRNRFVLRKGGVANLAAFLYPQVTFFFLKWLATNPATTFVVLLGASWDSEQMFILRQSRLLMSGACRTLPMIELDSWPALCFQYWLFLMCSLNKIESNRLLWQPFFRI